MKDKEKDLNFEKALADLEQIVEKLEKGGLSLNESLGHFEKGVTLARYLRAELDKAEKKVEILLKDEKEGIKAAPFSLDEAEGGGRGGGGGTKAAASDGAGDDGEAADAEAESGAAKKRAKPRSKKADDDSGLPF